MITLIRGTPTGIDLVELVMPVDNTVTVRTGALRGTRVTHTYPSPTPEEAWVAWGLRYRRLIADGYRVAPPTLVFRDASGASHEIRPPWSALLEVDGEIRDEPHFPRAVAAYNEVVRRWAAAGFTFRAPNPFDGVERPARFVELDEGDRLAWQAPDGSEHGPERHGPEGAVEAIGLQSNGEQVGYWWSRMGEGDDGWTLANSEGHASGVAYWVRDSGLIEVVRHAADQRPERDAHPMLVRDGDELLVALSGEQYDGLHYRVRPTEDWVQLLVANADRSLTPALSIELPDLESGLVKATRTAAVRAVEPPPSRADFVQLCAALVVAGTEERVAAVLRRVGRVMQWPARLRTLPVTWVDRVLAGALHPSALAIGSAFKVAPGTLETHATALAAVFNALPSEFSFRGLNADQETWSSAPASGGALASLRSLLRSPAFSELEVLSIRCPPPESGGNPIDIYERGQFDAFPWCAVSDVASALPRCLRVLDAHGQDATPSFDVDVKGLPSGLEELSIGGAGGPIADPTITSLAKLKSLTDLELGGVADQTFASDAIYDGDWQAHWRRPASKDEWRRLRPKEGSVGRLTRLPKLRRITLPGWMMREERFAKVLAEGSARGLTLHEGSSGLGATPLWSQHFEP